MQLRPLKKDEHIEEKGQEPESSVEKRFLCHLGDGVNVREEAQ